MSHDPRRALRLALLVARAGHVHKPSDETLHKLRIAIREAGVGGLEPEQISELAGLPLEVVRSLLEPDDLAG